jgi:hypothetical protein
MADTQKRPLTNKGQLQRKDLRGSIRPTHGYQGRPDAYGHARNYARHKGGSGITLANLEVINPYPENQFGSLIEYHRIMNEVADKIENGEIPRREPQVD